MKKQVSKSSLWAVCLCVVSVTGAAHAQQTTTLTGPQILAKVKENYANCQSYLDTGRVETLFITERGHRTEIRPFTTAFVRPAAFRFEFQSRRGEAEWNRYIVWQQGTAIKSLWTLNQQEQEFTDLGRALATATGVSSGAALTIPGLLMPDAVRGGIVKSLTGLKLLGEEPVGQRAAYKLEGLDWRGVPLKLWLDKERLLILQVFQKNRIEPGDGRVSFETKTTTFYEPQINEKVPAARLEFLAVVTK